MSCPPRSRYAPVHSERWSNRNTHDAWSLPMARPAALNRRSVNTRAAPAERPAGALSTVLACRSVEWARIVIEVDRARADALTGPARLVISAVARTVSDRARLMAAPSSLVWLRPADPVLV